VSGFIVIGNLGIVFLAGEGSGPVTGWANKIQRQMAIMDVKTE